MTDLADWFYKQKYSTFHNVPLGGKFPDMVAFKDKQVIAVEEKKHALEIPTAMGQCLIYQLQANKVFIGLPQEEINLISIQTVNLLKKYGIGLLSLNEKTKIIIDAKDTHTKNSDLIKKLEERIKGEEVEKKGKENLAEEILEILKVYPEGLTIEELSNYLRITRTTTSKYLYGLVVGKRIKVREIGKTKLHYLPNKFKIIKSQKGVSQLISTVLLFLITTTAIGIALLIGTPVIDKAKESAVFNEAVQSIKLIDNLIREVASEGKGSFRTVQLKVSGGEYKISEKTNTIEFTQTIKSGILASGTFVKEGNVFIAAGTNAKASKYDLDLDGTTDMVLENEIMRIALLNNATAGNGINTSRVLRFFNFKENGLNITINDSRIVIDNRTESSIGTGFTELVREDEHLAAAQAVVHVNSSSANFTYDVVYTLRPGADFLIVKIQNISDYANSTNIPTFVRYNFEYKIGDSKRDDVYDIGTINETIEATNVTRQFTTIHANLTNKYVCTYDQSQYSGGLLLSLIHSGKSDRLDNVNITSFLDANLVAFWKFDENTGSNATDSSNSGNNGNLTDINTAGNATSGWNSINCKFGSCLRFDGIDDYVNLAQPSRLDLTSDLTIALWANVTSIIGDYGYLVANFNSTGTGAQYALGINRTNGLEFNQSNTAGTYFNFNSSHNVTLNQWVHLAVVRSGTQITLYLNGTASTFSESFSGTTASSTTVGNTTIGRGGNLSNYYVNGTVDDVRIYTRALSAGDISRLYNSSFAQNYIYTTSIRQKIVGSSLIMPFTKGTCKLISDNYYLVANQEIPSKPFASFTLGGEDIPIQVYSTYDRLQLNGTDRFGSGSNKVCLSNEGVTGGKPRIWVRLC